MIGYVMRRLVYAGITFLGITLAVFLLMHAVPGNPVEVFLGLDGGPAPSPEVIEEIRREYRLDLPLWKQYVAWLGDVVRLDFGRSIADREPVARRIARRLPNTFLLALLALILALILAIPAGLLSAVRPNRWFDRSSGLTFLLLYSLPSFWAALLLMQLFSVKLQILPLYGMTSPEYDQLPLLGKIADRIVHLVLPVITLAYAQLAIFARFSRSALLEVIHQDFIVAARAKGLSESAVVLRHAFRNALIPLITLLGFVIPYLISGSVIVEQLFQWDGVGKLFFQSVLDRDYPTIMGLTVLTAVFTLIANLVVDLLYRVADPRIRVEGRHA